MSKRIVFELGWMVGDTRIRDDTGLCLDTKYMFRVYSTDRQGVNKEAMREYSDHRTIVSQAVMTRKPPKGTTRFSLFFESLVKAR